MGTTKVEHPAQALIRKETDSLAEVDVPADTLWSAQTQRSLEHFSIGKNLIPREMTTAYATLKEVAANANHAANRLDDQRHGLIVQVCDEILAGHHEDMFPLHVWMNGNDTQFNMNVNEVISNRRCQIAGTPLYLQYLAGTFGRLRTTAGPLGNFCELSFREDSNRKGGIHENHRHGALQSKRS
jgi:Lyase